MTQPISLDARVRAFASDVRFRLGDLGEEEITELTDGLEADLSERLADTGELGDPAAYVAELRSAAGLPDRVAAPGALRVMVTDLRASFNTLPARIRESPTGARLLDFFIALRPVWWVLRGSLIAFLVLLVLNLRVENNALLWVLIAGFILLSVQWGRDRWLPWGWLRVIRVLASIVAILAFLPVAATTMNRLTYGSIGGPSIDYIDNAGLRLDGQDVANIFAYDCNGTPLEHVQLFDGYGEPLSLGGSESASDRLIYTSTEDGESLTLRPGVPGGDTMLYNVYPLRAAGEEGATTSPGNNTSSYPAPLPRATVAPLPGCTLAPVAPEGEAPTEPSPEETAPENPEQPTP